MTASDGANGDNFGWSVATKGDVIVIGARFAGVYVYEKPASGWATTSNFDTKLTEPIADFGFGVSIAGNEIVIGAPRDNIGANTAQGSAFVYSGASTPPADCTPNDPDWASQWNMKAIKLTEALALFPGCNPSPVKIAIIDTGADLDNLDLASNIFESFSNIGINADDADGHGTHVAGIIGGIQNNSLGIAGIHPHAELLIYKYDGYFEPDISTRDDFTRIAELIYRAVDRGAKVINLSFGARYDKEVNLSPLDRTFHKCVPHKKGCVGVIGEAIRYAKDNDVVVVVASGNSGKTEYEYPAAYAATFSNVIAVAASTSENELAPYSTTGDWVTVSAPGGAPTFVPARGKAKFECLVGIDDCIVSLGFGTIDPYYAEKYGTSQASPHVAGVVALMLSMNPNLKPNDVRYIISSTASPFASTPPRLAGSGILDAEAAVQQVMP